MLGKLAQHALLTYILNPESSAAVLHFPLFIELILSEDQQGQRGGSHCFLTNRNSMAFNFTWTDAFKGSLLPARSRGRRKHRGHNPGDEEISVITIMGACFR
jgi:hypothetical protein